MGKNRLPKEPRTVEDMLRLLNHLLQNSYSEWQNDPMVYPSMNWSSKDLPLLVLDEERSVCLEETLLGCDEERAYSEEMILKYLIGFCREMMIQARRVRSVLQSVDREKLYEHLDSKDPH